MDPTIIAMAATGGIAVVGATYAYLKRGGSAEADVDGDGEPELVMEETEEDGDFGIGAAGGTSGNDIDMEEVTTENPLPDAVQEAESLSDIKGIGETRAADLRDAGIDNPTDVYFAADSTLTAVSGIGPLTVSQIREDIGGIDYEGDGEGNASSPEDETGQTSDTESEEQNSDGSSSNDQSDDGEDTGQ